MNNYRFLFTPEPPPVQEGEEPIPYDDTPVEANTGRGASMEFYTEIEQTWPGFIGWIGEDPTGNGLLTDGN